MNDTIRDGGFTVMELKQAVMGHTELTAIGAKWLKKHPENMIIPNCSIVAKELTTATSTGEIPDVIGWCNWISVLLEIKVSREDFKKDFKKVFRINEFLGIGELRYYLVPEGLINENEVPKNWGLLYYSENGIEIIKVATAADSNLQSERTILLSIIRRNKSILTN